MSTMPHMDTDAERCVPRDALGVKVKLNTAQTTVTVDRRTRQLGQQRSHAIAAFLGAFFFLFLAFAFSMEESMELPQQRLERHGS